MLRSMLPQIARYRLVGVYMVTYMRGTRIGDVNARPALLYSKELPT